MLELPRVPTADTFNALPYEEQEAVRRAARELHLLAYQYTAPITLFHPGDGEGTREMNSATGSLVRFDNQDFLVTAEHVSRKFHELAQGRPASGAEFRVGNYVLSMEGRQAWDATGLDVVFIELSNEEAHGIGQTVYNLGDPARHKLPTEGEYVVLCGFPSGIRETGPKGRVEYGAQGMILSITTCGEGYVQCQFDRDEWIDSFGRGIVEPGAPMGGLSGAPVFAIRDLHYPLIGVVTEFLQEYELLRIETILPVFSVRDS